MMKNYDIYSQLDQIWNPVTQQLVYKSICRFLDLKGSRILDLGCGKGDLLKHLVKHNVIPSHYVGVDIVDNFLHEVVEFASENQISYETSTGDFLKYNYEYNVDSIDYTFVVASTEIMEVDDLSVHICDVYSTLKKAWDLSEKGIVYATQSDYADQKDRYSCYMCPEDVLAYFQTVFSSNVVLDHSFAPNFFVVICLKGESEWERLNGARSSALKELE